MKILWVILLLTLATSCSFTVSRSGKEPFRRFVGQPVVSKTKLWLYDNENGQYGHGDGAVLKRDLVFGPQGLITILPAGHSFHFTKSRHTWDIGGGGTWIQGTSQVGGRTMDVQYDFGYDNAYGGHNPAQLFEIFVPYR
jgi:hypothetical protein